MSLTRRELLGGAVALGATVVEQLASRVDETGVPLVAPVPLQVMVSLDELDAVL